MFNEYSKKRTETEIKAFGEKYKKGKISNYVSI